VCLALAAAATIVAAAVFEEDLRGERAFRRFAGECAEDGKPLDYAFYKPAPIPDDRNMFRAPVLARFFNPKDVHGKAWNEYQGDRRLPWEIRTALGQWQRGRPADFAAAYLILEKTPPSAPDPDPRAAALLVLERVNVIRPELDALCAAARQRPESQIEFLTDGQFVVGSFGALRVFPTALSWRASAEIELGRYDAAFDDVYASLRLVEGAATFPSQLHLVMADSMALRALQPFWEGCVKGVWSESQLRTIQDLLAKFHPLRRLPVAHAALRAAYALNWESGSGRPRWMPSGWWKINIVRFFRSGAALDQSAFDPVLERIDLAKVDEADAFLHAIGGTYSPFNWLIRHEAWPPHHVFDGIAGGQNAFVLAGAACAVERYRLSRGEYPERLSQLVPAFLQSVPRDVIDGAPLRYARTGDGHFRLYSIGLNGIDDHGALPGASPSPSFPWMSGEGDWAWPQPARP
jgi:hypothetical protein